MLIIAIWCNAHYCNLVPFRRDRIQTEVKIAFLITGLEEEIFFHQPMGLSASWEDPSLFIHFQNKLFTLFVLYSDDILVTGRSKTITGKLIESLQRSSIVQVFNYTGNFLRITICIGNGWIQLHSSSMINHIPKFSKCPTVNIPRKKYQSEPIHIFVPKIRLWVKRKRTIERLVTGATVFFRS